MKTKEQKIEEAHKEIETVVKWLQARKWRVEGYTITIEYDCPNIVLTAKTVILDNDH